MVKKIIKYLRGTDISKGTGSFEKETDCFHFSETKIRNRQDFESLQFDSALLEMELILSNMVFKSDNKMISYPAKCQVCRKDVDLRIDSGVSVIDSDSGQSRVIFRETLLCPFCSLNNRQRAMARLVLDEVPADGSIYLTEQVTPMYWVLKDNFDNLIGSEFLGYDTAEGTVNKNGIRHENLMKLSFGNEELDCVVSNDVFEHVADIEKALKEIYRVLKGNGILYAMFPMGFHLEHTVKRAEISETGTIEHMLPPVYHGNPIDEGGSLVVYNYGWDFMSFVKNVGFSDAYFMPVYSVPYGNIGVNQVFIFIAKK